MGFDAHHAARTRRRTPAITHACERLIVPLLSLIWLSARGLAPDLPPCMLQDSPVGR
jgi:hypothetical protein